MNPAARSRVVIRLAENTKAKPNANTRTLRPDKCLVVSSLSPELRPNCPRNTGANAATTTLHSITGYRPRRHSAHVVVDIFAAPVTVTPLARDGQPGFYRLWAPLL
jgi:hypothetical protein